ncbi:AI-2E family transporter [Natronospirillum operosum]|uniref:AI-2E family transporter n=1 Tax=Natronospirillum operosum TaxID=2759953 RepID=A0A4Z0W1D4_9GAMM|nr:AI-2E family transporter [Natronospirillum operosum]TGG90223.1 AI-2E family transporter [Natronospirillum operosum]
MSASTLHENTGLRWLVGMASVIVIIAALKSAEAIVIPMMLALFISIISIPPLRWLTQHKVPPILAVLIILAVIVLIGSILTIIVISSIDTLMDRLPDYQERLESYLLDILPRLEQFGVPVEWEALVDQFNPGQAMDILGRALSGLGNVLTGIFLVVFIVLFILLEQAGLPQKLRKALPNADRSLANTSGFIRQVNKYLVIKTSISLVTGIVIATWLWFLGVDFAILWGLIAFLMNFIPNVGSLLAAIPAVLLAVLQLGFVDAFVVAMGYVAVNIIFGALIEPRLMGSGLGLSPLVVFLSLSTWGWLFGPVGMFLSIPLTMIVKIALEENRSTRWIAIMLGNARDELPVDVDAEERRSADPDRTEENTPAAQ